MDVTILVDVEADSEIVILLFGLSFYYAAVATVTPVSLTTDAAVIVAIAVSGLSFFSSSAVADVVETTVVSKINNNHLNGDGSSVACFFLIIL